MRNEEIHDQNTSFSVSSFQHAASSAEAANSKLEVENNSLKAECDRLKQRNASLDDAIRQKLQAINLLENEELRLQISQKSIETDLNNQQNQLGHLRRPREDVQNEKENTIHQSRLKIQELVSSTTNFLNNIVDQAHQEALTRMSNSKRNNNKQVQQDSDSSSNKKKDDEKNNLRQQISLLNSILQDHQREQENLTCSISQLMNNSSKKENEISISKNKLEESKIKNEEDKNNLKILSDRVNSHFQLLNSSNSNSNNNNNNQDAAEILLSAASLNNNNPIFSSIEEEISFLQQKLSISLPQEHSEIETSLRLRRDHLKEQARRAVLELDQSEEQVEAIQREYELLLDEINGVDCVRCGQCL